MAGKQEFSRLTDGEKDGLGPEPPARRRGGSPTCYRNTLICITILFIGVGMIIMGIAVHGKQHIRLVTLPALSGIAACGVLVILISIVGLYGAIKHNEVFLFVYIIANVVLFLALFSVSIAALSIGDDKQHEIIKEAWNRTNYHQKDYISKTLKCCGLEKGEARGDMCDLYIHEKHCLNVLKKPVSRALSASGGVGLFFALTLGIGAYVALKHRKNVRNPVAVTEGDALL